ncbi:MULTISPECIES: hypothetical protein [unclassified Thermosipho (in: thermotogales)]|uniref:hypothetical protein n=1 Tax=unclassified Thermosipho (in: thermotogales) TaxID=2676525 RepID=UPI001180FBD4|nr:MULTISPECIES: hypothetical protein [unclassified Thermosipho (in: thermotogales)]
MYILVLKEKIFILTRIIKIKQLEISTQCFKEIESFKAVKSSQILDNIIRNTADTLSLIVSGYFVLIGKLSFGGFVTIINTFWRVILSFWNCSSYTRISQILTNT